MSNFSSDMHAQPLLDECAIRGLINMVEGSLDNDTLCSAEDDTKLEIDVTNTGSSGSLPSPSSVSGGSITASSDAAANAQAAEYVAEYAECSVHNRKRGTEYLVRNEGGALCCAPGHRCKTPVEKTRDPSKLFWHFCESCLVVLNSERQLQLHLKGNKHTTRVADLVTHFTSKGKSYAPPSPRLVPECIDKADVEVATEIKQAVAHINSLKEAEMNAVPLSSYTPQTRTPAAPAPAPVQLQMQMPVQPQMVPFTTDPLGQLAAMQLQQQAQNAALLSMLSYQGMPMTMQIAPNVSVPQASMNAMPLTFPIPVNQ